MVLPRGSSNVRHISVLLVTLLLTEAFIIPPVTSLMMYFVPMRMYKSAFKMYKSMKWMMKLNKLTKLTSLAGGLGGLGGMGGMGALGALSPLLMLPQQLLQMLMLGGMMGQGMVMGVSKDACILRFMCEMKLNMRNRRRVFRRNKIVADTNKDTNVIERLALTLNVTEPKDEDNSCERKYPNCAYNSLEMLQILLKIYEMKNPTQSTDIIIQ